MDYCLAHELNNFVLPIFFSVLPWFPQSNELYIQSCITPHIKSHIIAYFTIYDLPNLSQGAFFSKFFHFHFAEACVGQHCSGVLSQLRRCRAVGGRSFRKLQRWSHQLGRRLVTSSFPKKTGRNPRKAIWKRRKRSERFRNLKLFLKLPGLWLAFQSPSLSLAKCDFTKGSKHPWAQWLDICTLPEANSAKQRFYMWIIEDFLQRSLLMRLKSSKNQFRQIHQGWGMTGMTGMIKCIEFQPWGS